MQQQLPNFSFKVYGIPHVGVKVSVGGSGARNCPSQVVLGGRIHVLPAPSAKRWHSLQMTPAEALAAAPDTAMQASTTCSLVSSLQVTLHRFDGWP